MPELKLEWALQVNGGLDRIMQGIFDDPAQAVVRLDAMIQDHREYVSEAREAGDHDDADWHAAEIELLALAAVIAERRARANG